MYLIKLCFSSECNLLIFIFYKIKEKNCNLPPESCLALGFSGSGGGALLAAVGAGAAAGLGGSLGLAGGCFGGSLGLAAGSLVFIASCSSCLA